MEFVTFEIAKKLKEKGFREECFARYHCNDRAYFERNSYHPNTESIFYCYNNDKDLGRFYIDAPTISQVLNWLRREKEIDIVINPIFTYDDNLNRIREYGCDIFAPQLNKPHGTNYYISYEKVALEGIEYTLDILI